MTASYSLQSLGWRPFFGSQVLGGEGSPARVLNVHRGRLDIAHESGLVAIELSTRAAAMGITVGDWVLVAGDPLQVVQRLDRFGLFQRRAAGTAGAIQL